MTKEDYLKNLEKYRWIQKGNCKIDVLDYILDDDKNFWIVNKICDKKLYGYIVYKNDKNGDRFNFFTEETYTKNNDNSNVFLKELPKSFKCVFKPNLFYLAHKEDLCGIWRKFADSLNRIGVADADIGVFGSYLIGFDILKDVDFVVYGNKSLKLCYKNIDKLKKLMHATSISEKHIDYQFNKHKGNYNPKYDLKKIISRNWSGIQIKDGVLSTIRFVDLKNQEIPKINPQKIVLTGEITNSLKSACVPRQAIIRINKQNFKIYTPYWKLQSFAREGDKVEVYGKVDFNQRIIVIEEYEDYIKFIWWK